MVRPANDGSEIEQRIVAQPLPVIRAIAGVSGIGGDAKLKAHRQQKPETVGGRYIENALHEYKKNNRHFGTMHANTDSLSDQDIADIAAYYAAQTPSSKNNPDR